MLQPQDERAFLPKFLDACTDLELVGMQHELRRFSEDRPYLDQVLRELAKRAAVPSTPPEEPR